MSVSSIITLAIIAGVIFLLISVFNRLVALRNRYQNAFAQIEVQLKRRYDLIPNLVETAKAYLKHERETLEAVIAARNAAVAGLKAASEQPGDAGRMAQLAAAENALGGAMGRLNVTLEAYPDLKASQNLQQVSEELSSTENKVAFARQAYNDSVMEYNTYRQSFPANVLAATYGHSKDASLLEFEDSKAIQAAPKVAF
ncbi:MULTISPECIES: LemA family protein [Pseudomonas]|mgnify:FL=1|uniref:LemA family protein n=1 Tax=Pseudomonas nitroreducens TaxID=46680 RepID=A0A6G6ITB7_PSENT|nr:MULTISPECIES: LemA family protein [Pseudomonas]MBG6291277.1 LemA family protein [Pseudomonas nitroreducens]MCE4070370.1 LemA family protein [Pseudomonas nitritireducens]MCE4078975.1 LemA family protein [Pseudomonas nitroreducens]MCJ1879943.1 LemA family protein [Pseudomonas nitroreducens]MCJ1894114.1 LemA family protein [Pseudomonas nitroreducens]